MGSELMGWSGGWILESVRGVVGERREWGSDDR